MNAASLLNSLSARGLVLTNLGEDIQVEAPKGTITDTDIQVIREHKQELLALLDGSAVPSRWDQYQDGIAHAFANPSTREEIGPLWMTNPDGFGSYEPSSFSGLCSPPQPVTRTPGICDRCGSDRHKDVPIHGGRSIRRDCAECCRFICWPKWNPCQEHSRP